MPRVYNKRDKKAEAAARYKEPSKEWLERRERIRKAYITKLPEQITATPCDEVVASMNSPFSNSSGLDFSIPAPNDFHTEETE